MVFNEERRRVERTFAGVTITRVAIPAHAVVAPRGVHAGSVLVARVMPSRALVQFGAVEFVHPVVTRKTLARVGADRVHALGVCVAVVALGTTLLLALVYVCDADQLI